MKILLAVSGGIDSMYMAERYSRTAKPSDLAVAHCNFRLRGEESDGDEAFVRAWCARKGIEMYSAAFDTAACASDSGISIEMAARELRYAWFAELCREHGFDAVAVAHNANDNAETMMLNLLRGTGGKGIQGMKEEGLVPGAADVKLLRPLLRVSREEIHRFMTSEGLKWREDHTNAENIYKRNKIRNEIFPLFAQINPAFLKALGRDMAHLGQEHEIAERYFRSCALPSLEAGLNLKSLMTLDSWEWLLFRLCEPYNLSEETFDKLVALLKSGRTISSKTFESPTHLLYIKGKELYAAPRI